MQTLAERLGVSRTTVSNAWSRPDQLSAELRARILDLAEELGYALAKEHSAADWSERPLPEEWLRYAALDVEFLLELRERLVEALDAAGKLEWAYQEFEAVRQAPDPSPRVDPWRRTSGLHAVRTDLGLGIVRELWQARDELAQRRDRAPGRVLPDRAIIAAALASPTTQAELGELPQFSGKGTRRNLRYWWEAVERARALPAGELPPHRVQLATGTPPPPRSWPDKNPAAAARLDAVRGTVRALAEEVEVPQENLLTPATQRQLAWTPPAAADAASVREFLEEHGARPWQIELTLTPLTEALRKA